MEHSELPLIYTPPASGLRYGPAVRQALSERRDQLSRALERLARQTTAVAEAGDRLVEALGSGHRVLVAGNGGSAAEAQHFAAELVGRFKRERAPYAVLALTADSSILTAIANDYGVQRIFSRQVEALGQDGDVLVAFSTSGNSENVVEAAGSARRRRMTVIALTGEAPNRLVGLADIAIQVPAGETALTQELHMVLSHLLCDIVESELSAREGLAG